MAHGAVPRAASLSSIPQYLAEFGTGAAISPHDVEAYATTIMDYFAEPDSWKLQSANASRAAEHFTYGRYLETLAPLLGVSGEEPHAVADDVVPMGVGAPPTGAGRMPNWQSRS
jgi:hypothetical protein